MKTKIFILTALAVLITTAGFATKFPTMNVISVDSEKAIVTFEPGAAKSFELKLPISKDRFCITKNRKVLQQITKKCLIFLN